LQDTRFYLQETVRLLKSLSSFGSLALVAVGCDVATNQTGGAWLASQQGIRPPTAIVLDSVPLRFNGWTLESGTTAVVQVGAWKGNSARHMAWFPVDTSINVARDSSWDSLGLVMTLDPAMARPANFKFVRNFWLASRKSDSVLLAGVYGNVAAKLGLSAPAGSDTIVVGSLDTVKLAAVPVGIQASLDSLRKTSTSAGLLVEFRPLSESPEGFVQFKSLVLRGAKGLVDSTKKVDLYSIGALNSTSISRSFLQSVVNDSAVPFLQGGPVHWNLRLSLDQNYLQQQLRSRGLVADLRSVVVLDAQLLVDADVASQDSVKQRVDLYSEVIGKPDTLVTLVPKAWDPNGRSSQAFDSVTVAVDTVTQGDSLCLKLKFTSVGGTVDSVFLQSDDTLPRAYSNSSWPLTFSLQRSGNRAKIHWKGLLAGLVRESPLDRSGDYRKGNLASSHLSLLARRPFAAMLNWSERRTDIILAANADDGTHWWRIAPDLKPDHVKVRLILLPVGGAQ